MLTVTLPDSTARTVKRWAKVQAQLNEAGDDRSRALLRALLEVLSKQVIGTLQEAIGQRSDQVNAAGLDEFWAVARELEQLDRKSDVKRGPWER